MEKLKITQNNLSVSNISQSLIMQKTFLKDVKNEDLIKTYKTFKNLRSEKINKHTKGRMSSTLYLNNSKIHKKYKNIFYNPGRRLNSTKINPEHLYKRLKFVTLTDNEGTSKDNYPKIKKKFFKKLSVYYYSANLPVKNKYIVDNLNQDKTKTMRSDEKHKVSIVQKKIDNLAKNLNLFQYKKISNNLKIVKNPFSKRMENIFARRDLMQNYNSRHINDLTSYSRSSFLASKFKQQHSSLDKTNYSKISQKRSFQTLKDNISVNNINKELPGRTEINTINEIKDTEENELKNLLNIRQKIADNEKKIMKNAKTSAKLLDSKDEFLYKNIFIYNNINKRKKTVNVIDNKLNIFYSENLLQYNQKMNRINDYLVKKGKPMIHQGVEKNSKGNMENMIKKIQFIKKIVDYVYPNMVLYKVRQEKKRISKAKSLEFKYPRSRINLLNLKEEQKKIDDYFTRSIMVNKL